MKTILKRRQGQSAGLGIFRGGLDRSWGKRRTFEPADISEEQMGEDVHRDGGNKEGMVRDGAHELWRRGIKRKGITVYRSRETK